MNTGFVRSLRIALLVSLWLPLHGEAFQRISPISRQQQPAFIFASHKILFHSRNILSLRDGENDYNEGDDEEATTMVEPGSEADVFSKSEWEDIQASKPSQWMVMKEVSLAKIRVEL
jgi:hypothetical protein